MVKESESHFGHRESTDAKEESQNSQLVAATITKWRRPGSAILWDPASSCCARYLTKSLDVQSAAAGIHSKRSADAVGLEVPGHEGVDFGCGPAFGDAGQGLREPVERIDIVHLGRLQERSQCGPGSSSALAAGE